MSVLGVMDWPLGWVAHADAHQILASGVKEQGPLWFIFQSFITGDPSFPSVCSSRQDVNPDRMANVLLRATSVCSCGTPMSSRNCQPSPLILENVLALLETLISNELSRVIRGNSRLKMRLATKEQSRKMGVRVQICHGSTSSNSLFVKK